MTKLLHATAIARVFPEGQKIIAFVMEYNDMFDAAEWDVKNFEVKDYSLEPDLPVSKRKILRVYTNGLPEPARKPVAGRYVILEMDTSDKKSFAVIPYDQDGKPDPFGPGPMCYKKPGKTESKETQPKQFLAQPGRNLHYCGQKPLRAVVRQLRPIPVAGGGTIPPSETPCTELACKEVEAFKDRRCADLPYSLFVPEHYDPSRKYPLVLFIPDAASRGTDVHAPLIQGIGGLCWASAKDQEKHPCFVACPAFGPDDILTHDDFTCIPRLYQAKAVLDEIAAQYSIDGKRIYTTGQSMGCMASCELMCTYPDYFAGAILVAGQWDPERCGKALARKKVWILVSENDRKAHPGMDAVAEAIEHNGGNVSRFLWDGSADADALNECAAKAILSSPETTIKYTLFRGDSVVPKGQDISPGSNHTNTWRVAYQISAIRDWLFQGQPNTVHTAT